LFALSACAFSDNDSPPDQEQPMEEEPEPMPPDTDYCNATDPRELAIVVSPTPESGEAPYVNALATAQSSIDVAVYLMGYGGILDTLKAKAQAGVKVRVILDEGKKDTNQKYFDQLVAAGAEVKWSDPKFSYFHAKFFVVDNKVAVFSTGNYSKSYSIDLERNFAATDSDPADVYDLVTLFEADWKAEAPVMTCTRMVVSPINARQRILDVINGAKQTLEIESMQFADYGVRNAVKARIEAGVQVRALLADASWIDANASAATFLQGLGVTVKWIPHLHTKVMVADGKVAYVGSENFSQTSLDKNREVGAILVEESSIAPLVTTFEKDWAAGTEF
jgi:phosphatidylserine/phosphatidylglycerophosphate/cardiolipin synthase-like enzyme